MVHYDTITLIPNIPQMAPWCSSPRRDAAVKIKNRSDILVVSQVKLVNDIKFSSPSPIPKFQIQSPDEMDCGTGADTIILQATRSIVKTWSNILKLKF